MGCTQSQDVVVQHSQEGPLLTTTTRPRRSLSQMLGSKQDGGRSAAAAGSNGHRDVFSIFGEHGMILEQDSPSYAINSVFSPCSASASAFSNATTTSDNERTQVRGPLDQYIPALHASYGSYSDKGMRKHNEDRKVCSSRVIHGETVAYFGIYDGHSGARVADYLAKTLHVSVFDRLRRHPADMKRAVEHVFAETDDYIFDKEMESGSTAVAAVMRGRQLLIASVGDSQAVLCSAGKARSVSVVHSPDSPAEKERILAAKGVVTKGRIFGLLAVSRAFGDNDFKTSRGEFKEKFKGDLVTAVPDCTQLTLTSDDEFIVLGCDGLFDVMQPQQIVDFVRAKLALHGQVQHACEELVSYAISIGSTDNVSAVIVCFNQSDEHEDVAIRSDA